MDVKEGPRRGGGGVEETLESEPSRGGTGCQPSLLKLLRPDMSPTIPKQKEPDRSVRYWWVEFHNSEFDVFMGNLKNGICLRLRTNLSTTTGCRLIPAVLGRGAGELFGVRSMTSIGP